MHTNISHMRLGQSWTFSLKSLMFFTFIVAVCSALVGSSAGLAALLMPLIAAALVRTIRVHRGRTANKSRVRQWGMFAVFCQSLLLTVCLLIVATATFLVGCCTGVLMVFWAASRCYRSSMLILHGCARPLLRCSIEVMRKIQQVGRNLRFGHIVGLIYTGAVRATILLTSLSRILLQYYWHPNVGFGSPPSGAR